MEVKKNEENGRETRGSFFVFIIKGGRRRRMLWLYERVTWDTGGAHLIGNWTMGGFKRCRFVMPAVFAA